MKIFVSFVIIVFVHVLQYFLLFREAAKLKAEHGIEFKPAYIFQLMTRWDVRAPELYLRMRIARRTRAFWNSTRVFTSSML